MDNLFGDESFNLIDKGDYVRIIGKDQLKGLVGIVKNVNTSNNNPEPIYSIELEATGKTVQRKKSNIKRYFPDV